MSRSAPAAGPAPANFVHRIPEGDDRRRRVCGDCGFIDYQNPKVVVGTLTTFDERILLCRRAIEPALGLWTHPAGHLERGETAEQGAIRETREETRGKIRIAGLLGVFSAPHKGVVEIVYRAELVDASVLGPTSESSEAQLFSWDEIPWDTLAFPSTSWVLAQHRETIGEFRAAS